jgi:hypothetical protein
LGTVGAVGTGAFVGATTGVTAVGVGGLVETTGATVGAVGTGALVARGGRFGFGPVGRRGPLVGLTV